MEVLLIANYSPRFCQRTTLLIAVIHLLQYVTSFSVTRHPLRTICRVKESPYATNWFPRGESNAFGKWGVTRERVVDPVPKCNDILSHTRNSFVSSLNAFFNPFAPTSSVTSKPNDYDEAIAEALVILKRASETKTEDPNLVFNALVDLEKLMRKKRKEEPDEVVASAMLNNLSGSWRLVFTTGTEETQKKLGGGKINYFPIKAVQSFDTANMTISNGIYFGDFAVVKFFGCFEFDLKKCKLEFDFDEIAILGFKISLGKGKAAEIGAASGLGSENNVKLVASNKKAFFNWISADRNIAAARGGGGGLALWKRVAEKGEE